MIGSETLKTGFFVTQSIYFVSLSVLQILKRDQGIKKIGYHNDPRGAWWPGG